MKHKPVLHVLLALVLVTVWLFSPMSRPALAQDEGPAPEPTSQDFSPLEGEGASSTPDVDETLATEEAPPPDETAAPDEAAAQIEMPSGLYEALTAVEPQLAAADPFAINKLYAGGSPADAFGFSVALDNDGDTAVVGAYGVDAYDENVGAAYVFTFASGMWQRQAKLYAAPNEHDDRFGISVSISGDGNTVLVGADLNDDGATVDEGGAYVFTRDSNGAWLQAAYLAHTDSAYAHFGWSVALSSDGQYALVGAYNADVSGEGTHEGKAYVYTRTGGWVHQQTLSLENARAYLGYSVDIDMDGNVAVLGAPGYNSSVSDAGAVAVFRRTGATWTHSRTLIPSDLKAGDWFGRSVAINAAGDTFAAGASRADVGGIIDEGAAYVWVAAGDSWTQQAKLLPDASGNADDNFGVSTAISNSGDTVVVGALNGGEPTAPTAGMAFVFSRWGTTWSAPAHSLLCNTNGDRCGVAVALSGDAKRMLVGADRNDYAGITNSGIVWLLNRQIGGSAYQPSMIFQGSGDASDYFGVAVALSDDGMTALVGAPRDDFDGIVNLGSAWVFVRSTNGWRLQARLVGSVVEAEARFGESVALSEDGNTALVGSPWANDGVLNGGVAYLYVRSGETWTLQHKIKPAAPGANDHFGQAVSISDDGQWVAIGMPGVNFDGQIGQGTVYLRRRSGAGWFDPMLVSQGGVGANFGSSLALSGDGFYLAVGAPGVASGRGSAYVFNRLVSSSWTLQSTLLPPDGADNDGFGFSTAIDDSGAVILIGAPYKDVGAYANVGQAYAYSRSSSAWGLFDVLTYPYPGSDKVDDNFGWSVSLSGDASWALIGVPGSDINAIEGGKVIPHINYGGAFNDRPVIQDPQGRDGERMGDAVAQSDNATQVLIGAGGGIVGQNPLGSAYSLQARYAYSFLYLPIMRK